LTNVVCHYHAFFKKNWPQKELNAMFGRKTILPIWHKLSAEDVKNYSPLISDIVGVKSDRGINEIVSEITAKLKAN